MHWYLKAVPNRPPAVLRFIVYFAVFTVIAAGVGSAGAAILLLAIWAVRCMPVTEIMVVTALGVIGGLALIAVCVED